MFLSWGRKLLGKNNPGFRKSLFQVIARSEATRQSHASEDCFARNLIVLKICKFEMT